MPPTSSQTKNDIKFQIRYEEQLNATQLEAVVATEGPQLVIAGAGSGKTRTLKIFWFIFAKTVLRFSLAEATKTAGKPAQRFSIHPLGHCQLSLTCPEDQVL